LILGSFGLACLLMSKGLFTIIPVGAGLGLAMLYDKQWKSILHGQWLAVVGLSLLFIAPTLYGYYVQFDAHPEKVLFGEQSVSGIKFFLWDSQWGRFTNSGPIKGSGDPTFFLHTMLWAYLPWAFLAYFALFIKGKSLIKKINSQENYTFFGFTFLFVVFSLSSFQLPHYLNALFPFLSILTAAVMLSFVENRKFLIVFSHIQIWSSALLLIAIVIIHFVFSTQNPSLDSYLIFIAGIGLIILLIREKGSQFKKIVFVPAITVLLVNYYLNRSFYPQLLTYQAESEVAFYMKNHDLNKTDLVTLGVREEMISFLQDRIVPAIDPEKVTPADLQNHYVFTDQQGLDFMKSMDLPFKTIELFPDFRITVLNGTFLNKHTRDKEIEVKYLVKVNP